MSAPAPYDGGPAFPRPESRGSSGAVTGHSQAGMSLRDWFAGKALPVVAMPDANGRFTQDPEILASWAYALADAMLAERAKGGAK